jgi:hypothetical protein
MVPRGFDGLPESARLPGVGPVGEPSPVSVGQVLAIAELAGLARTLPMSRGADLWARPGGGAPWAVGFGE